MWPDALIQIEDGAAWLGLEDRAAEHRAEAPEDVPAVLDRVERDTRDHGWHAAGFVTFEAGAAYRLAAHAPAAGLPFAWFGVYRRATRLTSLPAAPAGGPVGPLSPSLDRARFADAIDRIGEHLAAGDTYQVNVTFQMTGAFTGDARALWLDLVRAQRCRYGAFLRGDPFVICSASPELFLLRDGDRLTSRPMKGTAPRGRTAAEDAARAATLATSAKTRAENIMIVDMARNDLGRIADVGSVQVPDLCAIERYPNVLQMTSTVTARSRASLADLFAAAFPAASITGAPKIRTMEIIAALEGSPRGIYTGAIGVVHPDGRAQFNVAIRTAVVDESRGRLTYGVGAGIVADSVADAEYDECLLKASVLTTPAPEFDLLETLRWRPATGFVLLDGHLSRLSASARHFGIRCDLDAARRALDDAVRHADDERRVRLLVDETGRIRVESATLEPLPRRVRVTLAREAIDTSTPFVFHKTTHRAAYDEAQAGATGEVVFWNAAGQVTESTLANVVVEVDGALVTPAVECGLLAGVARAEALRRGRMREGVVTVDQFRRARRAWLLNSVRGWRRIVSGK